MDLLNCFSIPEDQKVYISRSQTGGQGIVREINKDEDDLHHHDSAESGWDYTEKYIKEEEELLMKISSMSTAVSPAPGLRQLPWYSQVDDDTIASTLPDLQELDDEEKLHVYNNYDFNRTKDFSLPITKRQNEIIQMIETNSVSLIVGATGCGKTTQVPQFILDEYASQRRYCNIIVTQPRRIAAISIATRVCEERGWRLGNVVGYQVGLQKEVTKDTRLCYATTGILLQQLISNKHMNNYTHVVLDEVHERDKDTDLALLVVKRFLHTVSQQVKVVLMSATIDPDKFAHYFTFPVSGIQYPAPCIQISQRSLYPIQEFFLDNMKNVVQENLLPSPVPEEPKVDELGYDFAALIIRSFDKIEKRKYEMSTGKQLGEEEFMQERGAVLVFLPGIHEIETMMDTLEKKGRMMRRWEVFPLHSSITRAEQQQVFNIMKPTYRKIILTTNIAESSITVPDVVYVIDFCLTKQLIYDSYTNYSSLQLCWASRANSKQRRGRAGRVRDGRVYYMVTKDFYETFMEADTIPEMLRASLEHVILQTKLLELGPPKALLALALDPPDLGSISKTTMLLKEAGAMLLTCHGRYVPDDGDLTLLGHLMARLPIDVKLSRLIMLGYIFDCLDECIIIAAGSSLKSIFSNPVKMRLEAYHSKHNWSFGSFSDCFAILHAYKVWREMHDTGQFRRANGMTEKAWTQKFFLELKILKEMHYLITDIYRRLKNMNIYIPFRRIQAPPLQLDEKKLLILKIVICGAFYPNYFTRGVHGGHVDFNEAQRTVCGRDPFSTVLLSGFPLDQPWILYKKAIKNLMRDCAEPDDMRVTCEGQKILIEFKDIYLNNDHDRETIVKPGEVNRIPGRIFTQVYKAVKMCKLRTPMIVMMFDPDDARNRMREIHKSFKESLSEKDDSSVAGSSVTNDEDQRSVIEELSPLQQVDLPSFTSTHIQIQVVHVEGPHDFWCQYKEDSEFSLEMFPYSKRLDHLISSCSNARPPIGALSPGTICLGLFEKFFYRARIESVLPHNIYRVFFVDYGNQADLPISELREIPKSVTNQFNRIPMLAFQCSLSRVKPSFQKNPEGIWSEEAINIFKNNTLNMLFDAQVYSVTGKRVNLDLVINKKSPHGVILERTTVSEELKRIGYAESAEESLISKRNHALRSKYFEATADDLMTLDEGLPAEIDLPVSAKRKLRVSLKGPNSPMETKFYGVTKTTTRLEISVDQESVNNVLLDADPDDEHDRLLVAAYTMLSSDGQRLKLMHTTLVPNEYKERALCGLPHIMALMFAPKVEMRPSRDYSCYTGAICGVGPRFIGNNTLPLFGENDMELQFDREIKDEDLVLLNCIRYWMNAVIVQPFTGTECDEEESSTIAVGPYDMEKVHLEVKKCLMNLLDVHRETQEPIMAQRPQRWNQIPDEKVRDMDRSQWHEGVYDVICGVNLGVQKGPSKMGKGMSMKSSQEMNMRESRVPLLWGPPPPSYDSGSASRMLDEFF